MPSKKRTNLRPTKRLIAEGKIKPGFVNRLGVKRQTKTSKESAHDKKRIAMPPGYRVSKSGNLYLETRQNRSDTPKQRKEVKSYLEHHKPKSGKRLPVKMQIDKKKPIGTRHKPSRPLPKSYVTMQKYPALSKAILQNLPEINEKKAYAANELNSWYDYKPGTATQKYRDEVESALEDVLEHKEKVDEAYHSEIDAKFRIWVKRLADLTNEYYNIEASYPSVMIAGPAKFSSRKKEAQNSRRDAWHKKSNELDHYLYLILRIGTHSAVKGNDKHAVEKLNKIVDSAELARDMMKSVNAWVRKHHTLDGYTGIATPEVLKQAREGQIYLSQFKPGVDPNTIQPFSLSGSSTNIRRVKARAEELEKIKTTGNKTTSYSWGDIVHNADENRLQLIFNTIPSPELRSELKHNGFKWSPKNKAWQRQITRNAELAVEKLFDDGYLKK